MKAPAQILNSSATRYQQAIASMLKFWSIEGQCKYCSCRADVKQLIQKEILINKEAKTLIKN